MGITKQIDIKNRTPYFYNDFINIKDFDPKLLQTEKKSYKNTDLYSYHVTYAFFRVNPHSVVALMSRNSLLEAGAKFEV